MTTLPESPAAYPWSRIEQAILRVSLARWTAVVNSGMSLEDGAKISRAAIADDIRRDLEMKPYTPYELREMEKK